MLGQQRRLPGRACGPGRRPQRDVHRGERRQRTHLRDPHRRHRQLLGLQPARPSNRTRRNLHGPIDAGTFHTCGIRTDGTIACWGIDGLGQSSAPEGGFTAVAAGWGHSCGVRTDGTVNCWGSNNDLIGGNFTGQATAPAGTFSTVSAGDTHTCGVRTDGTVACWGSNDDFMGDFAGQATAPAGTFSTVDAGALHSCGLRTDDTIACWGFGDHGQTSGPGRFSTIQLGSSVCRPYGAPSYHTAGFPLPGWAVPSIGTMRVAVLFVDFPDAHATHSTEEEAALGLPYAEQYLEAVSYGRLDVEFVALHRWLRAENNHDHYASPGALGDARVVVDSEALRLADPSFDFTGFDAAMTVLPSSHFAGGENHFAGLRTDEGPVGPVARVNTFAVDDPRGPLAVGRCRRSRVDARAGADRPLPLRRQPPRTARAVRVGGGGAQQLRSDGSDGGLPGPGPGAPPPDRLDISRRRQGHQLHRSLGRR